MPFGRKIVFRKLKLFFNFPNFLGHKVTFFAWVICMMDDLGRSPGFSHPIKKKVLLQMYLSNLRCKSYG